MKPNRSNLSVPGHREKMHAKALASDADVVMFDLEDSVPPGQKSLARRTIIHSLGQIKKSSKILTVRVNSVETPFAYKDIIEVISVAGSMVDAIVVPKVNHPGDIHFVCRLLDGIEMDKHMGKKVQIEACIETAKGLEQVSQIAGASPRIKSLAFGIADYSASIGARLTSISGHGENEEDMYPGHRWHYPLSRMVMAAKANNLLAIDAPYGDFKNPNGLEHSARMALAIGCDGKWVIHPDQIDAVNTIFTPSDEEIKQAIKIFDLFKAGGSAETRAIAIDGKMVDQATLRLAKQTVDQAVILRLI